MFRSRSAAVGVFFALAVLSLPTISVGADSTKFRIQDYIPERVTDFQWKLDGNIGLSRERNEYPTEYLDNSGQSSYRSVDGRDFDLDLDNSLRFHRETPGLDLVANLRLNNKIGRSSTSDYRDWFRSAQEYSEQQYESGSTSSYNYLILVSEIRRFLIGRLHLAGVANLRYSYHQSEGDLWEDESQGGYSEGVYYTTESRVRRHNRTIYRKIDFAGEALLGFGRAYDGRYAVTALFVLEELRKMDLLLREPGVSNVNELTKRIHQLRAGHGPDEREYREESLQQIINLLVGHGLLAADEQAALLRIVDVWRYFPNNERPFGWVFQGGFGGVDVYNHEQYDNALSEYEEEFRDYPDSSAQIDTTIISQRQLLNSRSYRHWQPLDYFIFRANWYYPLSLHWQLTSINLLRLHLNQGRDRIVTKVGPDGRQTQVSSERYWRDAELVTTLTYYHDSRNSIALSTQLNYNRTTQRGHSRFVAPSAGPTIHFQFIDTQIREVRLYLRGNLRHRFSVTTTLNIDWVYSWRKYQSWGGGVNSGYRSGGFDLKVGVTHWLF